jgi:hypothetical protein
VAVAVLLVAGGTTALLLRRSPQVLPAPVTGTTTVEAAPRAVADTSGIPGVLAWDTGDYPGTGTGDAPDAPGVVGHQHVPGPVRYAVTPPVGGPHDEVWMNAGAYTAPVPSERAVHDLEHGAVWITYDPDLPQAQVDVLSAFVHRQSMIAESGDSLPAGQASRYVVLSPWRDGSLPSPVVITAWGHQLRLQRAGDPRLQRFVDTFRSSARWTPEHGSPVDGVPVRTGGRPDSAGPAQPNPPGAAG